MSKVIYIELLDNNQLNVYHNQQKQLINDNELDNYRQYRWLLLDSLYVVSKVFTQPVNNKKLLAKVIPAHFESFLSEGMAAYTFAHQQINAETWVSWIENNRLNEIKQRFSRHHSQIIGLTATPLLFLTTNTPTLRIDSTPYSHFLFTDETLSLSQDHTSLWLQSSAVEIANTLDLDNDSQVLPSLSVNGIANIIPNLWQSKKTSTAESNSGLIKIVLILLVVLTGLWSINHWFAYQQAQTQLNTVKGEQQDLLKQALPNANTTDVYGRLKSEQTSHYDAFSALEKLLSALPESQSLNTLSIDLEQKNIEISPAISDVSTLSTSGFTVKQNANGTQLTWD